MWFARFELRDQVTHVLTQERRKRDARETQERRKRDARETQERRKRDARETQERRKRDARETQERRKRDARETQERRTSILTRNTRLLTFLNCSPADTGRLRLATVSLANSPLTSALVLLWMAAWMLTYLRNHEMCV